MEAANTLDRRETSISALEGLRVLVLLPPAQKDHSQRFARVVSAAKARWDWQMDALCHPGNGQAYQELVAPSGRIFTRPHVLEPAPWEADANSVRDVERRLRMAELAARTPAGQIVAAAPASIGRSYVHSARYRFGSPMARRVLEDNTEPFRIVRRFFAFADDMLAASAPELVLAHEWGTPLPFCIWLAATARGIPCCALRRSKIQSGHSYWTVDQRMLNSAATAGAAARRISEAPVSDSAKAYIQAFREQPDVSAYVEDKWQRTGNWLQQRFMSSWLVWPWRFARTLAFDCAYRIRGLDRSQRPPALARVTAFRRRAVMARRHRQFLSALDDATLATMNYVYFPMHKETDLPLTFQATPWQDQCKTVQLLASSLPYGYRLLVREHRLNYGQRPTAYYRHLTQLPNVVLIDPFDSQFKYLRHADLIVTENGSSGWEGLLLRRRVLTFAPNFYDGAGLSIEVRDLNQLSATVLSVLSKPAVAVSATHDRNLGHMIDAELATTFPDDSENVDDALERLAQRLTGAVHPHDTAPKEFVS